MHKAILRGDVEMVQTILEARSSNEHNYTLIALHTDTKYNVRVLLLYTTEQQSHELCVWEKNLVAAIIPVLIDQLMSF